MDLSRKEQRGFPPIAIHFPDAEDSAAGAGVSGSTPPLTAAPRQFRFPETPPPKFGTNHAAATSAAATAAAAATPTGAGEMRRVTDAQTSVTPISANVTTPLLSIVDASSTHAGAESHQVGEVAIKTAEQRTLKEKASSPAAPVNDVLKMALPVFSFDTFETTDSPTDIFVGNDIGRDKVASNREGTVEKLDMVSPTPSSYLVRNDLPMPQPAAMTKEREPAGVETPLEDLRTDLHDGFRCFGAL